MKPKFATVLFSLAACLGFADEATINQPSTKLPIDLNATPKPATKKSFGYLRMAVADPDAINSFQTLPSLALGYRFSLVQSAIDVSAGYTREEKMGDSEAFSYTAPRISYLRYISNDAKAESFYYGAGAAWSETRNTLADNFSGAVANAVVGYEMNRNQTFHSFFELGVSQPVANITTSSFAWQNAWKPQAELSFGLGF